MGFTPDACYGVCHCEKGLFRFAVTGKVGKKIVSFKAGTVVNAVPYKAEADVLCDDDEFAKLVEAANAAEVKFDIKRKKKPERARTAKTQNTSLAFFERKQEDQHGTD